VTGTGAERFRPEVAAALRAAGWFPGRRLEPETLAALQQEIGRHHGRFGARLASCPPAAAQALAEFGGLTVGTDRPGTDLNPRPFALDPTMVADSVETLVDAGRAVQTGLYPLGVEGLDEAILAINYLGQVLAIDAAGEWFLGDSIEAALDTLITGRQPARVGDDGRWPGRVWDSSTAGDPGDRRPIGAHKRPVGAAFFLPRSPANLHDVWLPDVLTRIGSVPQADPVDPAQLTVEWGELDCEAHVLDLDAFTVLVLAFELGQFLDQQAEAGRAGTDPGAAPLARAFRNACVALGPELDVALVQTRQTQHLLNFVAEREFAVLTGDSAGLLADGFPLLYLSAPFAVGIEPVLARQPRDELPVTGGRLIFRGTGEDRW
jgi:hypothetical protein